MDRSSGSYASCRSLLREWEGCLLFGDTSVGTLIGKDRL